MKKLFTLLTLALMSIGSAWGDDAVSATQTFSADRKTCTWTDMSVTVAKNSEAGGDGLYFVAGSSGTISTSGTAVNIKSGRTMYVEVPSASSTGSISIIGSQDKSDRTVSLNSGETIAMLLDGDNANFVASDVESVNGGHYIKVASTSDFKFTEVSVTLTNGTYPESVAVDPVFSLSRNSISTLQTAQIKVGTKTDLDGITLSGITYGTAGVVTVDAETGVVTPVAAGTTTINFNSGAVAGKYNASTGKSLTITVTPAIAVFDADGLYNQEIILSQANIEDKDYLSCNSSFWQDKGWSAPYNGNFLDMKTGRKITLKVKNAYAFELYLNGSSGRDYTIKVGDGDAETYTQSSSSGFVSSGVIATGTTGEVTIEIEGGESTLYPAYFIVNPAAEVTVGATGWSTYSNANALDFANAQEGIEAYAVTGNNETAVTTTKIAGTVAANTGLLVKGTANVAYLVPLVASGDAVTTKMVASVAGGTVAAGTGTTVNYVLMNNGGVAEFQWIGSTAATLAANKAYLSIDGGPKAAGARGLSIEIDGLSTGIKNIKVGSEDNVYYDLQGRRVLYPTKGLYIVNGKKVIIK